MKKLVVVNSNGQMVKSRNKLVTYEEKDRDKAEAAAWLLNMSATHNMSFSVKEIDEPGDGISPVSS